MHLSKKVLGMVVTVSIITSTVQLQAIDFAAMLNNRHNQATLTSSLLELWATKANNDQKLHLLSILISGALFEYIEHAFNNKTLRLPNTKLVDHLAEQCIVFLLAKTIDLIYGQKNTHGFFDLTNPARLSLIFKSYHVKEIQDLKSLLSKHIMKLLK